MRLRAREGWISRTLPVAVLVLASLLASCGSEPPGIISAEWRTETRPARQGDYESLSVFVNVGNMDPRLELESITVTNDAEGLSWKLTDASWTVQKTGADTWVGGADLASADYKALPRGQYRIIVTNLGGQRAESLFELGVRTSTLPIPQLKPGTGTVTLVSAWPENYLLAYDAAGNLVTAKELAQGTYEPGKLFKAPVLGKISSFAAYGYDSKQHYGAFSWRVKN